MSREQYSPHPGVTEVIQAHDAVNLAATTGAAYSPWFPCESYGALSVSIMNDAATTSVLAVDWSFDGAIQQGNETPLPASALRVRSTTIPVKAPYFRIYIANTDAAAHVISAWAYLRK